MTTSLERTTGVQLSWQDHDRHTWLAPVALAGLAVAVLFAFVGLPPVSIHGPLHFLGVMDPLCGMTRGTVAALRGDVARAVWFNPASPLVPIGGTLVLLRWAYGKRTRRWLSARLVTRRLPLGLGIAVVLALEVNQQLHAERLGG
jgi:hypothetical protein